jgi:biopolymer transport protein ExbD
MKFPRNARIFRGQLDAAPLAGVFFLLVLFVLLASLVYTPGVRVRLPEAGDLPGTGHRTIAVALDATGQLYFENQLILPEQLKSRLQAAVKQSAEPLTLVVQADRAVTYELLANLTLLAREAGIQEALLAMLPRTFDAPPGGPRQP